jgi:aryl sulfotransferase
MLARPALREYCTWTLDSRRLDTYRPRPGDIFICTYPKCGTTWMQHLVSMLVFQSPEPRSIHDVSLWPDTPIRGPIEQVMAKLDAQQHRRFIKAHLPLDGLPLYDEAKYIYVARDGRDAFISWHNHQLAYTPGAIAELDAIGNADPRLGRPFPRVSTNPRVFFRQWVEASPQSPGVDFFDFQAASWSERQRSNVLMVHYADLKADLGNEMRRIAKFLGITPPESLWPALVQAGDFASMRRDGSRLLPSAGNHFEGGVDRFLFKGTNGRWRDVLTPDDLALYHAKVCEKLSPGLALWLEHGMKFAGDPLRSAT